MADEAPLRSLAARQHGLAARRQFAECGLSRSAYRHAVRSGSWCLRGPRVLQLVGAPASEAQEAMLAVLDLPPGAALSHHSAAALWGLPGFTVLPAHVTGRRERGRREAHIGVVHEPRLFLPEHIRIFDGIPATTPTRTLFDLAGVLRWPQQVERALDTAMVMRLTHPRQLRSMLRQLARRGRPGIRLMRALIEERGEAYVPPASNLERRFQEIAKRAGITTLERQVDVGDDDWIGRVDFIDRSHRVVIEVQSDRYHAALLDVRRDEARKAELRAAGWTVLEVREHDIWHDPEKVIRDLRSAFW